MSGPYLTWIDELVDKISTAANREPIDSETIRGATMSLDGEARTKDQKAAVARLKRAPSAHSIQIALIGVQRAFLGGNSDADGWPRKF